MSEAAGAGGSGVGGKLLHMAPEPSDRQWKVLFWSGAAVSASAA